MSYKKRGTSGTVGTLYNTTAEVFCVEVFWNVVAEKPNWLREKDYVYIVVRLIAFKYLIEIESESLFSFAHNL